MSASLEDRNRRREAKSAEGLQRDRGLPDPMGEVFDHTDDLFDEVITAKTGPRRQRRFSFRGAKWKCKTERLRLLT